MSDSHDHHDHAPANFNAAFGIGIGIGIALNIAFVAVEAYYGWKVNSLALLAGLPGVAQVTDLHVWAMGTSETALTAHLVMPDGGGDDDFLRHATEELHAHFEIRHVTLQVTRALLGDGCTPVDGKANPHAHRPP